MRLRDDVIVELLEPVLQQFVSLIGLQATMVLVEALGGTQVYIPRQADENPRLVGLIGAEKAAILGRAFPSERPLIPKALPALRAIRDHQIVADLERFSLRETARKWRLGERQVCNIQRAARSRQAPDEGPNLPLFG